MHKIILPAICFVCLALISGCAEPETKAWQKTNKSTTTYNNHSSIGSAEAYLRTYVITDDAYDNSFVSREKRNRLNRRYYCQALEDEEKERAIRKRSRGWRRVIDGRLIVGYDKEEDGPFYKFTKAKDLKDC
jgi:hypothetical protein